jgi:pyroglutamyl-peptidase
VRVLLTGFGPFPGMPHNPAETIVRRLATSRALRTLPARVETLVLDTVWSRLDALAARIETVRPDIVVMVGVQRRDGAVRLERVARAHATTRIPDHAGRHAPAHFAADGPGHMRSRLRVTGLAAALRRAAAPVRVSEDAGRYLCNAALRTALAARVPGRPPAQAVFVHVPPPRPARGHRLADLERLVIDVLQALIEPPPAHS